VKENNIEDIERKKDDTNEDELKSIPSRQPSIVTQLPYKSPGTAALIAFIGGIFGLPGIGHIYKGKLGKGIGILILGLFLYAMMIASIFGFSPMTFIFVIWQIFSARGQAREFNKLVKESGKEPW
jgi:TM2 domain-containing membrane protein YozV